MGGANGREGLVLAGLWCRFFLYRLWTDKHLELSLVIENHSALLGRRRQRVFLCLLFLNYLQLKIILTSEWHIL